MVLHKKAMFTTNCQIGPSSEQNEKQNFHQFKIEISKYFIILIYSFDFSAVKDPNPRPSELNTNLGFDRIEYQPIVVVSVRRR